MYNVNDIFYEDEKYTDRAEFCNNNGFFIKEIDADENGRRFQICEPSQPTEEEMVEDLRSRREKECFPFINRGKLWYDMLTQEQILELNLWYIDWLNVTESKVIPEKPQWLK